MITTIMTHEVKNFLEWKKVFDADATLRQQAGVKIIGLYTSVDNPNLVTIISDFPSSQVFQKFMFNENMKDKMSTAGVIGEPTTSVLNKV
ncbi:MAG: DUF3764 family protein [Bacteroidota bacterium]